MFDAHVHVVEGESREDVEDDLTLLMMTSKKEEWTKVEEFDKRHIRCFGIHPWFAHLHRWEVDGQTLENLILQNDNALVGEIGLDKSARDPVSGSKFNFSIQTDIFDKQFQLAIKYQRPVSIHCVQSFGYILDYFRRIELQAAVAQKTGLFPLPCPPTIMLHSFSGSLELLNALIKFPTIGDRFYFSYSAIVNARSPKSADRIFRTPDDRILVESDINDISAVAAHIRDSVNLVSVSKGWTFDQTVSITTRNLLRYLKK